MKKTKKDGSLNGSEASIIELLASKPFDSGFPFEEILEKVKISRPVLSKDLKYLQKFQYIVKDPENRIYKITMKGRDYLKKTRGFEKIQYSGVPFQKGTVVAFPSQASLLPIKTQKTAFSNREVKVDGYFYLDQFSPTETTLIIEKMQETTLLEWFNDFFHSLGEQVAAKKGLDTSIFASGIKPPFVPRYQDMVRFERASLDYYASILLIFNGEEVARTINWGKKMQKAVAEEEKARESKKNFERRLISDEIFRKNWVENRVLDRLHLFQRIDANDEMELEDKLVDSVVEDTRYFLGASAEREVRKTVDDLKCSGVFKIIPKYKVMIVRPVSKL